MLFVSTTLCLITVYWIWTLSGAFLFVCFVLTRRKQRHDLAFSCSCFEIVLLVLLHLKKLT
jgi:hypothetical protein